MNYGKRSAGVELNLTKTATLLVWVERPPFAVVLGAPHMNQANKFLTASVV